MTHTHTQKYIAMDEPVYKVPVKYPPSTKVPLGSEKEDIGRLNV